MLRTRWHKVLIDLWKNRGRTLIVALAIAVGVFTYSRKVMETVGADLFRLSPVAGLIALLSSALVLFLFAWSRCCCLQVF